MEMQLQHEQQQKLFALDKAQKHAWKFLQVEEAMKQTDSAGPALQRLKTHLQVSSLRAGKVWKLYPPLKLTAIVLAVVAVISLLAVWFTHPGWQPLTPVLTKIGSYLTINVLLGTIGMLLIVNFITALLGAREGKLVNVLLDYKDIPRRISVGLGIGLIGWVVAFVHLKVFDELFKSSGRVK
jgi:hypothetical protein